MNNSQRVCHCPSQASSVTLFKCRGTTGKEPACQCRRQKKTQVWSLGQEILLEEGMATHSSVLAWRIPWTEEPGRQQSMGSQRAGHDWSSLACTYASRIRSFLPFLSFSWPTCCSQDAHSHVQLPGFSSGHPSSHSLIHSFIQRHLKPSLRQDHSPATEI